MRGRTTATALIHVEAEYAAGGWETPLTAGEMTVVDFPATVYDPLHTVVVGEFWNFTAPQAGRYRVNARVFLNAAVATTCTLALFINETLERTVICPVAAGDVTLAIHDVVTLAQGRQLDVRISAGNAGVTLIPDALTGRVAIERIQGS